MMSLLGGEVAALLPGMTGGAPAATAPSAVPQAFSEVLNTALDGLVAPDAAALALLSQQVSLLAPATAAVPPVTPTPTVALLATATDTLGDGATADGKSLPFSGSNIPLFNLTALQNVAGTAVFQNDDLRDAPSLAAVAMDELSLNKNAAPLVPLTPVPAPTEPVATDAAPLLPESDVFSAVADASKNAAHRDGSRNDDRAATSEQKTAVMDSVAALSGAMSPLSSGEPGIKRDSAAIAMLTPVTRIGEPGLPNPDSSPVVNGVVSPPLPGGAAPKAEFSIPQSPQQSGWGDAFCERVTFMVKQNLQEAEIRLNPPQLGQIDVRISLSNDQASLMFSSPHAAVRDAIETSMVRLRELLGEGGINLANVDVSDKSLAQQQKGADPERGSGRASSWGGYRAEFALDENAAAMLGASGNGRIDYYV